MPLLSHATWDAIRRMAVSDEPAGEKKSSREKSWAWWCAPVIPDRAGYIK
jgi:hypothetical protein